MFPTPFMYAHNTACAAAPDKRHALPCLISLFSASMSAAIWKPRFFRLKSQSSGPVLVESGPEDEAAPPSSGLTAGLQGALLPRGYPEAVAPEYMKYQLWDTLQVMTADLRGIIISQASLIGRGVGDGSASPLQTLQVDMIVSAVATTTALLVGSRCDPGGSVATMKRWRVYNTLLSYFGAASGLLQGMYPNHRLLFAASNTVVQHAVSPLGGGAAQAVVMHLSNDSLDAGFRADVAAKESNQDRLLGLLLLPAR